MKGSSEKQFVVLSSQMKTEIVGENWKCEL
jgi:hypothetical protein